MAEPETLGEYLRYERKRRGMRQKDLALATNANVWTVITWEKHGAQPSVKFIPAIIEWLGCDPFPIGETFGEKIAWKRKKAGLTRRKLAEHLCLNYGSVEQWERNVCKPLPANLRKLERLFGKIETSDGGEE